MAKFGPGAVGVSDLWRRAVRRGNAGWSLGVWERCGVADRGVISYGFFFEGFFLELEGIEHGR
jgi:hypothetical protein